MYERSVLFVVKLCCCDTWSTGNTRLSGPLHTIKTRFAFVHVVSELAIVSGQDMSYFT
jgi:hypothetical protein